jgi:hypothetical protein
VNGVRLSAEATTSSFAKNLKPILRHITPIIQCGAGEKQQPRRKAAFCVGVKNARGPHLQSPIHFNGVMLSHIMDLVNPDIALSVKPTQKYFLSELWGLTNIQRKRNTQPSVLWKIKRS